MSNYMANKTILVPFDFSDAARAAIDEAFAMADETSKIVVLHVLVPMNLVSPDPALVVDVAYDESHKADVLKNMQEQVNRASEQLSFAVRVGDPGSQIVEHAKQVDADFVVMPSHGRTGLPRLLLGSVAERVLRLSECPVIVLRHKKDDNS